MSVVFALAPSEEMEFFLDLFLYWSLVAYWVPTDLGVHLSVSYLFAFSYCSWGSQDRNTEVICHSLLQWTTFSLNQLLSKSWLLFPSHLMSQHIEITLEILSPLGSGNTILSSSYLLPASLFDGSFYSSEVKSLSHVWLFATQWAVAYQDPQSMRFSRQEYWSGLPFSSPGDLPDPGIEPGSPAL